MRLFVFFLSFIGFIIAVYKIESYFIFKSREAFKELKEAYKDLKESKKDLYDFLRR